MGKQKPIEEENLKLSVGINALTPVALPFKKLKLQHNSQMRVMIFSPDVIYDKVNINPFSRIQSHLSFKDMFPDKQNGKCSCGCEMPLTGRRRRWASDNCTRFACAVWAIIDGQAGVIEYYVRRYYGKKCAACSSRQDLKVDHIIPVKHGGGGCWLSNFQLLCHACHIEKTNKDFGWKQKQNILSLSEIN